MDDNKYTLDDLVISAIQQKPVDFEQAFSELIVDRLYSAVETRKQEIAQNMFATNETDYESDEEQNYEDENDADAEEDTNLEEQ